MVTIDPLKNGASASLASGINATATTLSLTSGTGVNLPASGPYYLTLADKTIWPVTPSSIEVVQVTGGYGTDTLTIARGQDGTTGRAFVATDLAYQSITRALLIALAAQVVKLAQGAAVPTGGSAPPAGALIVRDGYGYVAVGTTQPTAPGEYIWYKTDGNGNLLDMLIGKN